MRRTLVIAALLFVVGSALARQSPTITISATDAPATLLGQACNVADTASVYIVVSTGAHIACVNSVWTDLQIGESFINPAGAGHGDALVYNSGTAKFEPQALPGGGDMLAATYATGTPGVVDLANALEVDPSPCTGTNFVQDIAADGTLTCSPVPSDTSVRMAHTFADAGTGVDTDEYTGWADAFAASSVVVLQPGEYQVPAGGLGNLPDNIRIICRSGAVIEWPASRTVDAAMFTIPAGVTAEVQGCSFQPGKAIDPVNGHADGDGMYFMVGSLQSQTPATVRIIGNTFGKGILASSDLDWKHIHIQGAADVLVEGNRFDFANYGVSMLHGSDGQPSWTVKAVVRNNDFAYSAIKGTSPGSWFPMFGSNETATYTNIVTLKDSVFSGNRISLNSGRIVATSTKLSGFVMQGNVVSGDRIDTLFRNTVRDAANTAISEDIVIQGNVCSGISPSQCVVSAGEVAGFLVSGNHLTSDQPNSTDAMIVAGSVLTGSPTSTDIKIHGNQLEFLSRSATPSSAIFVTRAASVEIVGNKLTNGPAIGVAIGDVTSNTSASDVLVAENTFINRTNDTNKLTSGAFRFMNDNCTRCVFRNNVIYDVGGATVMFAAPTTVPALTAVGNMGGADGFLRYRLRGAEEVSLAELVTLKKHALQTASPYTVEFPRDAPTMAASSPSSVLTYRASGDDYWWAPPAIYENAYDLVFPSGAGADSNATTANSANALDLYRDRFAATVVSAGVSGHHTWSFGAGSETGRVTFQWTVFGGGPVGQGSNCTNAVLSFQYSTNSGGAYSTIGSPITCNDTQCSVAGGAGAGSATQYTQSINLTLADMTTLRARVQVNGTSASGSCAIRTSTVGFQRQGNWGSAGTAIRLRRSNTLWPADYEFGRGVAEDISFWIANGAYVTRWAFDYEAGGSWFEFDQDGTLKNGVRMNETQLRVPTDIYLGTGLGANFSFVFDDNDVDASMQWNDSEGRVKFNNTGLYWSGAGYSGGLLTTALGVETPAGATTGQSICLKEGADDGTEAVCDKVPDAGLDLVSGPNTGGGFSGGVCTRHPSGRIPDECVGDGSDAGGSGSTSGAAGDVQYSDGASGHVAEAAFNYNDTTDTLAVPNLSITQITTSTPTTLSSPEMDVLDGGVTAAELTPGTVNDNDCTGQIGQFWWDATDLRFEFCHQNTGVPFPFVLVPGVYAPLASPTFTGTVVVPSPMTFGGVSVTTPTGTGAMVLATSPALAGNPTGPAPPTNDNDTSLATTGFVSSGQTVLTNKTLDVQATGNDITTVDRTWYPAAGCVGSTASSFFDLFATGNATPACITGTNKQSGVLEYNASTDSGAQFAVMLPSDWTGAVDVTYKWRSTTGETNTVVWCAQVECRADGETDDQAFPVQDGNNCVSDAGKATGGWLNDATDTGITMNNCAAGELANFRISRDVDDSSGLTDNFTGVARLVGVMVIMRRLQ